MTSTRNTNISKVVYFPRHLARLPERPLETGEYVERRYERLLNEPWSALEARVRERHPEVFALLDSIDLEPKKKWWQIWK